MKKNVLIGFLLCASALQAQTILIKDDVEATLKEPETGPNKKHYYSQSTSYGLLFGEPDSVGAEINVPKSWLFELGYRSKRQFSGFFAVGNELNFNAKNFNIKQTDNKIFGGFEKHKKERLLLISANYTLFTRFNFVKRGNHLGKYLDLGGYGEYAFISRHLVKDKIPASSGYTYGKYSLRGLNYLNRFNYGVTARIGFSFLSFFCNYRLSDMFKTTESFDCPELPRFCAGISFDVPG